KRKVRDREPAIPKCECDNCGAIWDDTDVDPISDLWERVDPGGVMPSGQCPDCGALCYPQWSAGVHEMRQMLNELLEWEATMGGFDAEVWTRARAMRDRLAEETH